MYQLSENTADLFAALAAAQGELENAAKSSVNPHFKAKYADLATVLNTVRPVFAKHGLAVVQMPQQTDGEVSVTTMLTHSSGQHIASTVSTPIDKMTAQGVGTAITYMRRYALAAMTGVAQEDDDGNAASQRAPQRAEPEPITNAQIAEIGELADAAGKDVADILNAYKVGNMGDLSARQGAAIVKRLKDAQSND